MAYSGSLSSSSSSSQRERARQHRRKYLTRAEREEFEELREMGEDPESIEVLLYMYDTTDGAASLLDPDWVKKRGGVEAIWHSSIVVFGEEVYYGRSGITRHRPETTCFGEPVRIVALGESHVVDEPQLWMFCRQLEGLFSGDRYSLLTHNCNTFTVRFSNVIGDGIPKRILNLPTFVH